MIISQLPCSAFNVRRRLKGASLGMDRDPLKASCGLVVSLIKESNECIHSSRRKSCIIGCTNLIRRNQGEYVGNRLVTLMLYQKQIRYHHHNWPRDCLSKGIARTCHSLEPCLEMARAVFAIERLKLSKYLPRIKPMQPINV